MRVVVVVVVAAGIIIKKSFWFQLAPQWMEPNKRGDERSIESPSSVLGSLSPPSVGPARKQSV